jgi:putative membrane protein
MLIKMVVFLLAYAGALLLIDAYVPGIEVGSFYTALIVAVLWGVLGWTLKPLLNLLALPINILTFGLFSFVISALLFWFLATFVSGFTVAGFVPALIGSLALTAVGWALHALF